jgi:hypothetical protein
MNLDVRVTRLESMAKDQPRSMTVVVRRQVVEADGSYGSLMTKTMEVRCGR